jgi:hypothetical protein
MLTVLLAARHARQLSLPLAKLGASLVMIFDFRLVLVSDPASRLKWLEHMCWYLDVRRF